MSNKNNPGQGGKTASRQSDRKTVIAMAALTVFSRDGFAAARIDDIAEEAGVAKGTIYNYFKSKEEMFEEAVRAQLIPVIENVHGMQAEFSGSAEDLLRKQLRFVYDRLIGSDLKKIMLMIISEGHRFPKVSGFYFNTIMSRARTVMRKTVDYGIATGEFRAPESNLFVLIMMSPVLMANIWKLVFDQHESLDTEELFEVHLDFVLRALRKVS